jgi:uncharacterized BrkB/YihY/UPF0761 family membrane protein
MSTMETSPAEPETGPETEAEPETWPEAETEPETEPGANGATVIAAKRPVRVWDVIVTIILIVLGIALALVLAVLGSLVVFVSDSCSDSCNIDQLTAGVYVAVLLPGVLILASSVWAIVRIVRRKVGFWVILLGAAAAILGWMLGAAIAATAVPGFTFS